VKKVVKIMAGLLLGFVIVAGVKSEAKAYTYADYARLLGYNTSTTGNAYMDYYQMTYTGYSYYDQYLTNYATALYQYEQMTKALNYMYAIQNEYENAYYYLYNLAYTTQPYVNAYGGTNPYALAMDQLLAQYSQTMNQFNQYFGAAYTTCY